MLKMRRKKQRIKQTILAKVKPDVQRVRFFDPCYPGRTAPDDHNGASVLAASNRDQLTKVINCGAPLTIGFSHLVGVSACE